ATARGSQRRRCSRIPGDEVERGLELGKAPVRDRSSAPAGLAVENRGMSLHERGTRDRPGLRERHGEALEVAGLDERLTTPQRRPPGVVLDEAGGEDIGVGGHRLHRLPEEDQSQWTRVTLLVGEELVVELV